MVKQFASLSTQEVHDLLAPKAQDDLVARARQLQRGAHDDDIFDVIRDLADRVEDLEAELENYARLALARIEELEAELRGDPISFDALGPEAVKYRDALATKDARIKELEALLGHSTKGANEDERAFRDLYTTIASCWHLNEELVHRLTEQVVVDKGLAQRFLNERDRMREALEFYADPETYFGVAFMADRPCGDFVEDFEELTGELGHPDGGAWEKPGKRARAALDGGK
jgi:hypothetical protein